LNSLASAGLAQKAQTMAARISFFIFSSFEKVIKKIEEHLLRLLSTYCASLKTYRVGLPGRIVWLRLMAIPILLIF
jgi:hypothetical protein